MLVNEYSHITENERYDCFNNEIFLSLMIIIFVPCVISFMITMFGIIMITCHEIVMYCLGILTALLKQTPRLLMECIMSLFPILKYQFMIILDTLHVLHLEMKQYFFLAIDKIIKMMTIYVNDKCETFIDKNSTYIN
jgi:hypothetical protein